MNKKYIYAFQIVFSWWETMYNAENPISGLCRWQENEPENLK